MTGLDWSWSFAATVLPALLRAAINTVIATFLSFALAIVLGLGITFLKRSRQRMVAVLTGIVAEFIRRTPPLVQIYVLYFGLPSIGIALPALTTGVIALGIHFATYLAEVYRAGIDDVPRGQWDAALALALPRWRVLWWRIVLPQALRPILPALGNYLLILFKETPLLSAISVVEMLDRAKIIGSYSFRYTEPITEVGVIFLVLSLAVALPLRRLERRLGLKAALD
jgi:polar amino acid transport system permease protein